MILCQMLIDCHKAFSLEEGGRGETDLIQFKIDTGDSPPKRQYPRQMSLAMREEMSRQVMIQES